MPAKTDVELFADIKKGEFSSVYFLYGEELHFKQEAASRIIKANGSDMAEFNTDIFRGDELDIERLADSAELLPMMAQKRLIVIKGFDVSLLQPSEAEQLEQIISDVGEGTLLLIVTADYVLNFKKKNKNEIDPRWTRLVKAAQKAGVACEFKAKDETMLARAIADRAKKAFKSIDISTAKAMVERCGKSWSRLSLETDKLIAYLGERREITEKDIEECCVRSISASAFDIAKGLLQRNYDKAYRLVDDLFADRQSGISIISAVAMTMTDLYRAKALLLQGGNSADLKKDFNYGRRGFAADNAFRSAADFSMADIRIAIAELYNADLLLKTSSLPERLVVEQAIGRIKALASGEKNAG